MFHKKVKDKFWVNLAGQVKSHTRFNLATLRADFAIAKSGLKKIKIISVLFFSNFFLFPQESTPLKQIENSLSEIRTERTSLGIRPTLDLPLTLPFVEGLLKDPLNSFESLPEKIRQYQSTASLAEMLRISSEMLGISLDKISEGKSGDLTPYFSRRPVGETYRKEKEIPFELEKDIKVILDSIKKAKGFLDKSVNSLSKQDKENILNILYGMVSSETHRDEEYSGSEITAEEEPELSQSQRKARVFRDMEKFDLENLLRASYLIAETCDKIIPKLEKSKNLIKDRKYIKTPYGNILISSQNDDEYKEKDLEDVILLIDFGGNNSYSCPVATAKEGEIRIVVDFGKDIKIENENPTAGSGILGIGLLYLPNPDGKKIIHSGDFSQGCGLLGVGGIFLSGENSELECESFGQGAGGFGVGILYHQNASSSVYSARFLSEGVGITKGLGLFSLTGNNITLKAGLSISDPREPDKATTSLCQGVGYGPRAFAGGGIGFAIFRGDMLNTTCNYLAQGCGYWHSLGVLSITGNDGEIKARRYNKGSGVHAAIGGFFLSGNKNKILNWGVGPAFGWDLAFGICSIEGDENFFQADWGCGRGDANGHGISFIKGNKNRLFLPGYGSGSFVREAPSYGIAVFEGKETQLHSSFDTKGGELKFKYDPWGVLTGDDIYLSSSIAKLTIDWPEFVSNKPEKKRGKENILKKLEDAEKKSVFERLSTWLNISASFSLYPDIFPKIAREIISVPLEELPILLKLYSPFVVEEMIILKNAISSFGERAIPQIIKQLEETSSINTKQILLSLLGSMPYSKSVPILLNYLKHDDWRLRMTAASSLGGLLNIQEGIRSGRLAFLKESLLLIKEGKILKPKTDREKKWINSTGQKYLSDIFGILSLSDNFTAEEKKKVYDLSPDMFVAVKPEALTLFGNLIVENKKIYQTAIKKEIEDAEKLKPQVRQALIKLLKDADKGVQVSAITALGQIGEAEDAKLLLEFLEHPSSAIREGTISALAKFGKKAFPLLKKHFLSSSERTKSLIATCPFYGWDESLLELLEISLKDQSPLVRSTALSVLSRMEEPLIKKRKKFMGEIRRLKKDTDNNVKVAAQLAETIILPETK